jgi:hypothetical protein
MRTTRIIISAFVALALGALLSLGFVSPSSAADQDTRAAAPARDVSIKFGGGTGSFRLTGKVSPKGKGLKVSLQYKRKRGGTWKTIKKDGTNQRARYGFYGLRKAGFFRVKVPRSRGYRTSYSKVVKVRRL